MKEGILRARGTFVICEEIDLCDVDFHARALAVLEDFAGRHGHRQQAPGRG